MKLMIFEIPGEGSSGSIAETGLGQLSGYYQMCRRYGIDYFERNPGNTVYYLLLENQNLLFTFCRRKNQYSIRYLTFGRTQMEESWLNVMDYVRQVHRETSSRRGRVTESDRCFEQNLELLEQDVNRSLRPFSFIVSSLPDACFPESDRVRIYNAFHTGPANPEEMMVPLHLGDAGIKWSEDYEKMRKTVLRPVRPAKAMEWELSRSPADGKHFHGKSAESVMQTDKPDTIRMSAIEDAFYRLWEK